MTFIIGEHIARMSFNRYSAITQTDNSIIKFHFCFIKGTHFYLYFKIIIKGTGIFILGAHLGNREDNAVSHQLAQGNTAGTQICYTSHFKPAQIVGMMHNTHHISFNKTHLISYCNHKISFSSSRLPASNRLTINLLL